MCVEYYHNIILRQTYRSDDLLKIMIFKFMSSRMQTYHPPVIAKNCLRFRYIVVYAYLYQQRLMSNTVVGDLCIVFAWLGVNKYTNLIGHSKLFFFSKFPRKLCYVRLLTKTEISNKLSKLQHFHIFLKLINFVDITSIINEGRGNNFF